MDRLQAGIQKIFQSRLAVHLIFCFVFILFFMVPALFNKHVHEVLTRAIVVCLYFLGTTYVGRWCCKKYLLKNKIPLFSIALILMIIILAVLISLYIYLMGLQKQWEALTLGIPLVTLFLALGVFLASSRETLRRQMKDAEISDQQKRSELELLRSQLSPHFLFNTLNNLYGLSISKPDKIPALLVKLSELLRYSVYDTRQRFVSLHDELAYIWNYIELEKIRIEDRLQLHVNIEQSSESPINICPMILIVFVENAFKHSKNSYDEKLEIAMRLYVDEQFIHFSITNSCGQENSTNLSLDENSGVGLTNTIRRLELLYPNEHKLEHYREENRYHVHLQLKKK
jgi:two-component system LytT family sensor kinase